MAGGTQGRGNSCAGSVDMSACQKPPKPISTSPFDYVRQIVHRAESGQQPRLEDPSAIHPVGPDIDRIIDAAAMAFQLGQQLQLTNDQAGALAERYETNPEAHVTVLGSSGVYEKTAEELGANAFEVEDPVWKGLTRGSQWDVNRAFLDRVIQRGDTIILASSYGDAMNRYRELLAAGASVDQIPFYLRELLYLESKGYRYGVNEQGQEVMQQ